MEKLHNRTVGEENLLRIDNYLDPLTPPSWLVTCGGVNIASA